MNKFMLMILIILNSQIVLASKDHGHDSHKEHAHEEHDEHKENDYHQSSKLIGEGKAILVVDEVKGIKLSKEAIKTLKLKLQNIDGEIFEISKETLVTSRNLKGIYRFREGFFKFLPLKLIKEVNGRYLVNVKDLDFGDQIVTNGVGLLRVSDIYSKDNSEYGHSH